MNCELMYDGVWRQQQKYEEAEAFYQAHLAGTSHSSQAAQTSQQTQGRAPQSTIKNEIAQARQHIQNVLKSGSASSAASAGGDSSQVTKRLENLERENKDLRKVVDDMKALVKKLESRVDALEKGGATKSTPPAAAGAASATAQSPKPATQAAADDDSDDSDIDLFGDDETEEEKLERERRKAEALEKYKEKKAKKPALIAKSTIILDVKPWDDETDMNAMEAFVRSIEMDGLLWGASKFVPVGYGIKKLQISCVVEDDKVGTDDLEETITANEDLVQSVDIVAFNKI